MQMKAMIINKITPVGDLYHPLELVDMPIPIPMDREILIKVSICGVCHTELDEIEGRTPPPVLPIIPGHQVVGYVVEKGRDVSKFKKGDRVGVAWIFSACGRCLFCSSGNENLCPEFKATGRDANGGYAEYMTAHEDFVHQIPDILLDAEAAPLLCAGAVGYRSLKLTNMQDGFNLGLTGFGASGHLVMKMVLAKYPRAKVFVFARSADERAFAHELGAFWTGSQEEITPNALDCVIDTTPVWKPVIEALRNLRPGGRLVINAIRKEGIDKDALQKMDYTSDLWMEKAIKSVANVTRLDVKEFLSLAASIPIRPEYQEHKLEDANRALSELKKRKIRGAKVLRIAQP